MSQAYLWTSAFLQHGYTQEERRTQVLGMQHCASCRQPLAKSTDVLLTCSMMLLGSTVVPKRTTESSDGHFMAPEHAPPLAPPYAPGQVSVIYAQCIS